MLRRRLIIGLTLAFAALAMAWLDWKTAQYPGAWLFPVLFVLIAIASVEIVRLCRMAGLSISAPLVHLGNLGLITTCWLTALGWIITHRDLAGTTSAMRQIAGACSIGTFVGFTAMLIAALFLAMRRHRPEKAQLNYVAGTVLAVAYVGLTACFLVQLRMAFGMKALVSMLVIIKLSDTGAYAAGRIFGRRPMAPILSPNKTLEGALGAVLTGALGSALVFYVLIPLLSREPFPTSLAAVIIYGAVLSVFGILGDLAESLIKREANTKDSSQLLPALGGSLDLLDSALVAAPVAYLFWLSLLFT